MALDALSPGLDALETLCKGAEAGSEPGRGVWGWWPQPRLENKTPGSAGTSRMVPLLEALRSSAPFPRLSETLSMSLRAGRKDGKHLPVLWPALVGPHPKPGPRSTVTPWLPTGRVRQMCLAVGEGPRKRVGRAVTLDLLEA